MSRIPVALRIGAAIVSTTAFYSYLGQLVPQVEIHPPELSESVLTAQVSTAEMIELGRGIFDGKGLCSTCHTRGDRPVSPAFPDLSDIGARAADRVEGVSALAYLSQSLYEPSAFVVPGYAAAMPSVSQPPVGLDVEEIRNVIAYLQSLGGEPTITASTTLPVALTADQLAALAAAMDAGSAQIAETGSALPASPGVGMAMAESAGDNGEAQDARVVIGSISDQGMAAATPGVAPANEDTPAGRGSLLYARVCAACHGPSAEGNVLFNAPRLAGQESWYVTRQLKNFAEGIRGTDPSDVYGLQMRPMAMTLQGEEEIADVAAYLASIPQ